ncbi:MAG: hypothetical protein IJQ05_01155 [Bacteroidaceae bacterium]|nr:hypothetical protein [Bacteroidaceae bacterium]
MIGKKHYFSFRFKGGNAFHQNGSRIKSVERIVNIGETADCDVRYDSNGFRPEYYASIIKNEDGNTWRIVKRSQYIDINIEGKGEIGYVHQLEDGDIIQFSGQHMSLCFHSHFDNKYSRSERNYLWHWTLAGALGLIVVVTVFVHLLSSRDSIRIEDVEPLEESVCYIKVDSVRCLKCISGKEKMMFPTKKIVGDVPTGTAFLTQDGKLITARHCVEYWIGANLDLTTKVEKDLAKDNILRWAIECETFNQFYAPDSVMQLRVYFSVYNFMGNKIDSLESTNERVHINREKDGVFQLADFNKEYYWRSVRPYFNDRSMELGDILWIDGFKESGKIKLAGKKQMTKVKNGSKLMICGYPMTGIGDKRMTFTEGSIRRNAQTEAENLFFESNINHGFSGGPVLMKVGSDIVAIGVVSRVDSISNGLYKWAVPITEINREKKEGQNCE